MQNAQSKEFLHELKKRYNYNNVIKIFPPIKSRYIFIYDGRSPNRICKIYFDLLIIDSREAVP